MSIPKHTIRSKGKIVRICFQNAVLFRTAQERFEAETDEELTRFLPTRVKRVTLENVRLPGQRNSPLVFVAKDDGQKWFLFEGPALSTSCTCLTGDVTFVRGSDCLGLFKDNDGRIFVAKG